MNITFSGIFRVVNGRRIWQPNMKQDVRSPPRRIYQTVFASSVLLEGVMQPDNDAGVVQVDWVSPSSATM